MKVAIITRDFWPSIGGAEKGAMLIAKFRQRAGDKVIVISRLKKKRKSFEIHDDLPIFRIKFPIFRMQPIFFVKFLIEFPINIYKLLKIVFRFKPDLIYVQFLCENAIMASLLTYVYTCRLVVSPMGQDTIFYKNNFINRFLLQRILNKADKIVFNSEAFCNQAVTQTGYFFKRDKIVIVPCGIDVSVFDKQIVKYILPNNKQYVFSCGRVVFDKGFDILIKAFSLIYKQYPDIDLVIVGDGDELDNLKSLVNTLNITDRVHLLGSADPEDMAKYYLGCLFFVIPSRHEAFGNVILEAMAARKTVVGSNVGGISGIIKDNFSGYLFESENCEVLAEKIRLLVENKEKRDLLGLNARQTVERHYTLDNIYQKHWILIGGS